MNQEALLDLEYAADIKQLREELNKIRKDGKTKLKKWLEAHQYLSNHDLAMIANVTHRTIYKWKNDKTKNAKKDVKVDLVAPSLPIKSDGMAKWVVDNYNAGKGVRSLSKAIGVSHHAINTILRKNSIKIRNVKESRASSNQCKTIAWVFKHYVELKLSQSKCAKLAGVSISTFSSWLVDFGIRIRTSSEQRFCENGAAMDKVTRIRLEKD